MGPAVSIMDVCVRFAGSRWRHAGSGNTPSEIVVGPFIVLRIISKCQHSKGLSFNSWTKALF